MDSLITLEFDNLNFEPTAGLKAPVRTAGLRALVRTAGLKTPVRTAGVKMLVRTAVLKAPVRACSLLAIVEASLRCDVHGPARPQRTLQGIQLQ